MTDRGKNTCAGVWKGKGAKQRNENDTNTDADHAANYTDNLNFWIKEVRKNKKQKKSSKADKKIDRDAQSSRNTGIKIQRGKDEEKRNT